MFNSIISTHRGRLGSLKAFLRGLHVSSKYAKKDFEVVISDLHPDESSKSIIDSYKDKLPIVHLHHMKYRGTFWKTKCINNAVLHSSGYYITHLDIDGVVTPHFFDGIEDFYSSPQFENAKLAHRVRFINKNISREICSIEWDEKYINNIINNFAKLTRMAKERYTLSNTVNIKENVPSDWANGKALGCSHFTMRKSDFISIGGMDENMIGWGSEDTDFNWRAFRFLGGGHIRTDPKFSVYDVVHPKDWNSEDWYAKNHKNNSAIYDNRRKNNIIVIDKREDWGEFK